MFSNILRVLRLDITYLIIRFMQKKVYYVTLCIRSLVRPVSKRVSKTGRLDVVQAYTIAQNSRCFPFVFISLLSLLREQLSFCQYIHVSRST